MTISVDVSPDRRARRMARLAWVVCGLTLAAGVGRLVLAIVDPASSDSSSDPAVPGGGIPMAVVEVLFLSATAVIGAVVAHRRPQNPIGWIIGAIALFFGITDFVAHAYWTLALGEANPGGAATATAWLSTWSWLPAIVSALVLFPLLFPTGRPPTPRWRWVQWLGLAGGSAMLLNFWFAPGKLEGYPMDNPVGIPSSLGVVAKAVGGTGFALLLISMLASVASIVVRFRRSQGEEREQIKWVAAAAVLFVLIYAVPFGSLISDDASFASILFGVLILAGAVAVSILKYRLYDIDLVISRTLLVAGLVAFITAAYVGIVVGVGSLLGGGDGDPNVVLSVVATTVVAVAFQPVRRWLQRVANRVVFGRRSTPYDVLSGFATRVGGGESSPESLMHVAELLADGTGADPARVWLRVGARLRVEATWPPGESADEVTINADGDPDTALGLLPQADLVVPVVERGELLGVLTIAKPRGERVTEVDTDLVERVAAASGVVLRNLRLDAELAQRLEDLEASRRRLVSAQDDARRRIEAELAGGARAALDLVRDRLTDLVADVDAVAAPKTAILLGQLVDATDGALGTLAGLAAGVYPPRLAADGLVVALTEQAGKAALPVEVHADGVGRYPPEVEAAAYFAVLEALQNVAKYANATSAHVRLTDHDNALSFEVVDDGTGFDPATTTMGSGLQGISDRLDTVGGALSITSSPGDGTTITGRIPSAPSTVASVDVAPQLTGVAP